MIHAYTDGSFINGNPLAGWAFVIIDGQKILQKGFGTTTAPALSRNIDGELWGAIECLKALDGRECKVHFDYAGIEMWAVGKWKANSEIAKWYLDELAKLDISKVTWVKVKGHTGVFWNEFVDKLAYKALT